MYIGILGNRQELGQESTIGTHANRERASGAKGGVCESRLGKQKGGLA